jgi:hypothetical protein
VTPHAFCEDVACSCPIGCETPESCTEQARCLYEAMQHELARESESPSK